MLKQLGLSVPSASGLRPPVERNIICRHPLTSPTVPMHGAAPLLWDRVSAGHENWSGESAAKRWRGSFAARSASASSLTQSERSQPCSCVMPFVVKVFKSRCRACKGAWYFFESLLPRFFATACSDGCLAARHPLDLAMDR